MNIRLVLCVSALFALSPAIGEVQETSARVSAIVDSCLSHTLDEHLHILTDYDMAHLHPGTTIYLCGVEQHVVAERESISKSTHAFVSGVGNIDNLIAQIAQQQRAIATLSAARGASARYLQELNGDLKRQQRYNEDLRKKVSAFHSFWPVIGRHWLELVTVVLILVALWHFRLKIHFYETAGEDFRKACDHFARARGAAYDEAKKFADESFENFKKSRERAIALKQSRGLAAMNLGHVISRVKTRFGSQRKRDGDSDPPSKKVH